MKRLIKKAKQNFAVGDKVIYKTHPYDNTTIYTVEEVLTGGTYFIANEETAYTDINGRNLEKLNS
ncbi:MAG: hypothetical protein K0R18_63 [Bacillales bacterium]|jgi:hypothetical protein|nr:hypothetical protein [Bacillales bacterium]